MKRLTLLLAATAAASISAGAAFAQDWMPINARQQVLDQRIDTGIRNGDLTRNEAQTLRREYQAIARLEASYRRNGLTGWERSDLDRRFDALSARISYERHDSQDRDWYGGRGWTDRDGRWVSINDRQEQLERRIRQGVRSGQLTAVEAGRLRADFESIARVERSYRRHGLSPAERADLDRRFDVLAQQIHEERTDRNRRYGYNR